MRNRASVRCFFALKTFGVVVALLLLFWGEKGELSAADDSSSRVVPAGMENQSVDPATSTDEERDNEDLQKSLDNIRFERQIDYVCLNDDDFVRAHGGFQMVKLLRDDKYQEVIEITRSRLNELMKTPPWEAEYDETSRAPVGNIGFSVSVYLYLLAVALELNKQYDEALQVYGVIYKYNIEEFTWSYIRIKRSLESQGKDLPLKPLQIPFYNVVQVVQDYHDLTPENVTSVLEKVKATEEYFFQGKNDRPGGLIKVGMPVLRDLKGRRDLEALELYRLRDRCAQVACPKLHFIYPSLYVDSHTTAEVDDYAKLTRQSFAEFLDYMESEYQTFSENLNHEEGLRKRAEDTMILLRSMKNLPH